jgi:hypothetical protein
MGLQELENGHNSLTTNRVSLMVDESIKIGEERLLVVLCCDSDKSGEEESGDKKVVYKKRVIGADLEIERVHPEYWGENIGKSGLSFGDMRICHIESQKTWNALEVSYVLDKVIKKMAISGQSVKYIQTDGEIKLKNAVELVKLPQSLDISHGIGNCLKKTFEKEESFISFTKLIASYQSKGVNQSLTYLIPPKQRTKARFMNLKPIVVWAGKMLKRKDKLNEKESIFFEELPQHTPMIELLKEVMFLEEKVTTSLKINGLNQKLLSQIVQEVSLFKMLSLGIYDDLRDGFAKHFELFLSKYQILIDKTKLMSLESLNVSTDIIESLFAKYKQIMPSNKYNSMASSAVELPIYCTKDTFSKQQIMQALEDKLIADLNVWKEGYSIDSQAIKRRNFFKN